MKVFAAIFVAEPCLFLDYSGVFDHLSFFRLRLCVFSLDRPCLYALDYTMATDTLTMNLDSRRNCVTCKTRISSLLHDSNKICSVCRGFDCSLDERCSECEAWSEEGMTKYVKYRKSLDSKSKAKKEEKTSFSDQASLSSSRDSNVSLSSAASAWVSEAKVTELISSQLGQFSASFAASMQASFDNIRAFIDERFAGQDVQPESNPSFADSSPVPVDLGPRQTQTDPSVRSPCVDFGSGGEAQEPVQADSATSSFLASLGPLVSLSRRA